MKIIVAGKDQSEPLGAELSNRASQRVDNLAPQLLLPSCSATALLESKDEGDFLVRYTEQLRLRHGWQSHILNEPPARSFTGRVKRACRSILWRLLRHQHHEMGIQQGLTNELLANALQQQRREYESKIQALENRIARLEEKK